MSEVPHQWAVVAQGNVTRHALTLTPERVFAATDAVVRSQGHPLLGQEVIAQHLLYGVARDRGVSVILDGQGADELLGGLSSFTRSRFRELARTHEWSTLWQEVHAHARLYGEPRLPSLARAFFPRAAATPAPYAWLSPEAYRGPRDAWSFDAPDFQEYLRSLILRTNLPMVLAQQDRASMAHGVESRVPFLDHRIVSFCDALPSSYRLHRGVRKRILRDAARGILPASILDRSDKGTIVSSRRYLDLRGAHGDALRACAADPVWNRVSAVEGRAVAPFVLGFMAGGHDDHAAVWRLYTTWRWLSQRPLGPS